jgi:hypothetical protein
MPSTTSLTARLAGVLLGLTLAAGACADKGPSLRERCESAREHAVDVRIGLLGDPLQSSPEVRTEIAKHRATLTSSLGERYLTQCREHGERFARCVTRATTPDELRQCQPDATTAAASNTTEPKTQETHR